MLRFPRFRSINTVLLWGLLAGVDGCVPARSRAVSPGVTPDTAKVVETPAKPETPIFPHPPWKAATYRLATQITTEDKTSTIRDTAQYSWRIHVQPSAATGKLITLRIMLMADSTSTSAMPADSDHMYQVDTDGALSSTLISTQCSSTTIGVSPLYIRLLMPRYAERWPQTDSLNYETCIQGVRSRVASTIIWQSPALVPTRLSWIQSVQVRGRLSSDSSRVLPLHLQGTLEGSAKLTYPVDTTQVSHLDSQFVFTLQATNSTRQQQIQQTITIQAIRR